jgi:protein-S-isoprenylcysteine O-methyltransferase Ste14
MFLVGFILAGLDFRFGWSKLPDWVSILGAALFLTAYALYAEVLRENRWLSRTIEVQQGQTVVSTGLYGIVRHPMYAVTIWLFLAIPLVLGSWVSLLCFLHYPILMVVRIRGEEALLTARLAGYAAYKKKVKYRLIPFIW